MKVIVIGSGISGLASAIHMAKKGHMVTVIEASPTYGGKLNAVQIGNYRFDTGPSLFTMPQFVVDLLDTDLKNEFKYKQLDTLCNYFFSDSTHFSVSKNQSQFVKEASIFFNEPEESINALLKKSKSIYDITSPVFLENSLHKWSTYLSKTGIKGILNLWRLNMFTTMHNALASKIANPKLVQFFDRYATYNGSNPYSAPATLLVIPHLEFHHGAYLPENGMRDIADILYKQAIKLKVEFKFNETVESIQKKEKVISSVTSSKDVYTPDFVIANCDAKVVYQKLLNETLPPKIKNAENSSSALIFYWGIKKTFPELDVHNIFFSADYKNEFNHIFNLKSLCDDPTVYINITSKKIKTDAPSYGENWFVMINAPYNQGQSWEELRAQAKKNILQKLSKMLNEDIGDLIEVEDYLDPIRIETRTSSDKGSLYGSSSNNRLSAFFRQANFSSKINNLYFCGGSVHPGGGIPLCLLSAQIVNKITPNANPRK